MNQIRKARSTYHQNLIIENRKNFSNILENNQKDFSVFKRYYEIEWHVRLIFNIEKVLDFLHNNYWKYLKAFIFNSWTNLESTQDHQKCCSQSCFFLHLRINTLRRRRAQKDGANQIDLSTGMLKDFRTVISTSLAFIINMSLQTSTAPTEWKTALITPIHKKGT